MAQVVIKGELADRLHSLADQRGQSVETVLTELLHGQAELTHIGMVTTPQTQEALLKADRLRMYERARRYWRNAGDEARASLSDDELETEFWLFDPDGVPRLKADMAYLSVPLTPMQRLAQTIEADPEAWALGQPDLSERSRDILQNEFVDYLTQRLNRPSQDE